MSDWKERIDKLRTAQQARQARQHAEREQQIQEAALVNAAIHDLLENLEAVAGLVVAKDGHTGAIELATPTGEVRLDIGTRYTLLALAVAWDREEGQPVITPDWDTKQKLDLLSAVEQTVARVEAAFVGDQPDCPVASEDDILVLRRPRPRR